MEVRSIAKLKAHPNNPRGPVSDTDPRILELVESIRQVGLLQPLIITAENVIVAGHRRHVAARLAGLETVPVVVRNLTPFEQLAVQMAENIQRADLTVSQEARGYAQMLEAGSTIATLARRLGVPRGRIDQRLKILELDESTRALVDSGDLPTTAIGVLVKITDLDERARAIADLTSFRKSAKSIAMERSTRVSRPMLVEAGRSGEKRGPCPTCAELRGQLTAALAVLRRAETVIEDNLGRGYVPIRPDSLWRAS